MPPVVLAVAAAISAVGVAATIGVGLLTAAAVSLYQTQKRKMRDAYNANLKDRLVNTATADGARKLVLGECRVGGDVVYKAVSGGKSEFYTLVVIFASHEIKSFKQFYVGDVPVSRIGSSVTTEPFGGRVFRTQQSGNFTASTTSTTIVFTNDADQFYVTYPGADGKRQQATVTSSTPGSVTFTSVPGVTYKVDYQCIRANSFMLVDEFLGGPGQDIHDRVRDPTSGLFGAYNVQIEDSDKFAGMAGAVLLCSYDPTAYPGGVPAVTALIEGCTEVYDPRTELAGYSDNPALCARYIATHPYAGGRSDVEMDDAAFIAAANACDTTHTYTDSEGVETTTKLYRCGYVAKLDMDPEVHLGELVEAMGGRFGWSGGRLRVRAGVYSSPAAVTIDDSWLAGGISIKRGADIDDVVNIYRPTIADSAQNHVAVPLPELRIDAYIAEDGQELPDELTMSAVTFAPQAMHICGVMARDMRWGRTYQIPCNLKAYPLEIFDVVRLNLPRYNAINKPVEVLSTSFTADGKISLTLKETDATIYQPDAVFEVDIPSSNTALTTPWYVPPFDEINEPESGTAHLLTQSDGSVVTRVYITYPAITEASVLVDGAIDISYSVAGSEVWTTETFEGRAPSVYLKGLQDGEIYLFKGRLRTRLSEGPWSAQRPHRVIGKTERPADVSGLSAAIVPGGVKMTWAASTEADYATTELHAESVWSDATAPLFIGRAATYTIPWPAQGSLTILAKHIDTTGNKSLTAASVTLTVDATIFIGTSYIAANAVTNGSVVSNATTTGGSLTVGSSVAAGFLVGPTITTVAGDEIDVEVYGTHIQRLFFAAYIAEVEIWMTIGFGGPEIGVRRKFQMPFNAATGDTKIPILMSAQITPGAATSQIICEYTVTCIDATGSSVSALKDWESEGEWRSRRTKR